MNKLVRDLAYALTFHGHILRAFSARRNDSRASEAELAARYRLILKFVSAAKDTDERLRAFAQWTWAELGVEPNDALGAEAVSRLISDNLKRVRQIPFNDLRYAGIVKAWLPYAEGLLNDVEKCRPVVRDVQNELRKLGYDSSFVELAASKSWRSAVALTCEWLAMREGIEKVKQRRTGEDTARTLRNAYTRILGRRAPRLIT